MCRNENRDGAAAAPPPVNRKLPQHGVNGVYYGGDWLDIEDCAGKFDNLESSSGDDYAKKCKKDCSNCPRRSKSRHDASKDGKGTLYDVIIVGAGCIGSAIARELSKYQLSVLLLEAADDVSQGATKGNSGIVHAGYDDTPGSVRAKFCWPGNQMFPQLDKELRFGYQRNGSLVLALNENQLPVLEELRQRGDINGVKNLKILNKKELFEMEPNVNPDAIGALFSPDAGNVIPYEYAIALSENAVDNGVELRIRREVSGITKTSDDLFNVTVQRWEPSDYSVSGETKQSNSMISNFKLVTYLSLAAAALYQHVTGENIKELLLTIAGIALVAELFQKLGNNLTQKKKDLKQLVDECEPPKGSGGNSVTVEDMFTGGSGSRKAMNGRIIDTEKIQSKYIINCAGGYSDRVAAMIGDTSFTIKPRLGDYLLLNRNQVSLPLSPITFKYNFGYHRIRHTFVISFLCYQLS